MGTDSRLNDLLSRWEQLRDQGQAIDAESLCRDSPELLGEFRRHIKALESVDPYLTSDFSSGPQTAASPPQVRGYEILGELGRGGMGVVYKARQIGLKRLVALKMILAGAHAGAHQMGRFRSEAESVARLQHANIVQIHEIGEEQGRPFLSLEFVDGGTLAEKIAATRLSPQQSAHILELLSRAMHAAHVCGVVHRDLKPSNILLTADGTPKISDFGLAKQLESDDGQTQTGAVLGTPSYMAPEQAAGHSSEIGPLVDVYALGALLYELLTGQPPFRGATHMETLEQVRQREAEPPVRLQPRCPRDLQTICLKCLAKDPASRYISALALAEDLERFQTGQAILARPEGLLRKLRRKVRRHRVVAAATLAVLAATAAAGYVAWSYRDVRELANVQQAFDAGLEGGAWTPARLDEMEVRASAIEALAPERGVEARRRLLQQVADASRETLRQGRLLPADVAYVKSLHSWLATRDASTTEALQRALQQRLREWEAIFDLKPPFANLAEVLDPQQVRVDEQARLVRTTSTASGPIVLSRAACPSNAQLQAELASVGELTSETGLLLNASEGHRATIACLAMSPDGKTLATGSMDGVVRLWDLNTARTRQVLRHSARVVSLAFSPDGRTLASGNTIVSLWDPADGRLKSTLSTRQTEVTSLAFAPDSNRLACGGMTRDVQVWDTATATRLFAAPGGNPVAVSFLAFTPEGALLVGGRGGNTVKIWNLATKEARDLLLTQPAGVMQHALSRDGKTLASGGLEQIKLWDVATGQLKMTLPLAVGWASALAFSPDGGDLATGGSIFEVWDLKTRSRRSQWSARRTAIVGTAWSPDGASLATLVSEGSVQIWNTATGHRRTSLGDQGYAFVLAPPELSADVSSAEQAGDELPPVQPARPGDTWRMQILRNGVRQREQEIRLPAGTLRLLATREGDRLQFQVNEQPPLEFRDLFPLGTSEEGAFGLNWSSTAGLVRLRASRQALPAVGSPLERADDFYARGQFAEALELYQNQSIASGEQEAGGEARTKAALCLTNLNRQEDAAQLFERVAAELVPRWSLVAACQLWLLRMQQQRGADADAIFEFIATQYRFEELAGFVSDEVRGDILYHYNLGVRQILYNPREVRDRERAVAMAEFLHLPLRELAGSKIHLIRAYRMAGQEERALQVSTDLIASIDAVGSPWEGLLFTALPDYCWMLRQSGQADRALEEVDRRLYMTPGKYRSKDGNVQTALLLERARIHAAQQEWGLAEKDLAEVSLLGVRQYYARAATCLIQGFLREQQGDADGAQAAWQQGLFKTWRKDAPAVLIEQNEVTPDLHAVVNNLIMASLTDQLDDAEAKQMLGRLVSTAGADSLVESFVKLVPIPPSVWRQMWRTPRGREYARQIAFRDLDFAEYVRAPVYLTAAELLHQTAIPGDLSPDQEELIWQHTQDVFEAYSQGTVSNAQVLQAAATWKGATNLFGWGGLAPSLDPRLRGPVAYFFGQRYRLVLKRPADAAAFFRAAQADAAPDSLLERLLRDEPDAAKD